jgi:hypothetical protein
MLFLNQSATEKKGAPTVPSAVIRRSNEFEDFRCHEGVKVSQGVAVCHIYIIPQFAYLHFLHFVNFLLPECHIVSQCDTCHGCHICDMCHTSHKYYCHVSLVIQCVIRGLLGTDLKKVQGGVGWGGQIVVPRPLAFG